MSVRTGRPPTGGTTKDKGYRLRMSEPEMKQLDYCVEVLGISKAEIIRRGINEIYEKTKKQNNLSSGGCCKTTK